MRLIFRNGDRRARRIARSKLMGRARAKKKKIKIVFEVKKVHDLGASRQCGSSKNDADQEGKESQRKIF